MSPPREVFISHATENGDFAEWIADVLERHGISAWLAHRHILGAGQWQDEIGAALRRCDWFLLLLSPHAVESVWVRRELQYALCHDRFDRRLTPVLLETCETEDLSWVLPSIQTVETDGPFEALAEKILAVWDIAFDPNG
ncbi:MAG: toll/interleukin-1 receptor domain-containing protein [Akkermansiaceae bacterium]|nr:toll/interleukin-1 receptor domain-containing protein [Akkermansiaceae bacterium]MCP5549617.1 toll/interleukin-1 receptor domain-containing protein [Akkermansiaceae bacterium]